jgi:predicted type IV restriction endonuclease
MPDKDTLFQLQRYATAFREARERNANESDTVMYLVKFFEDVLGYDSLKGEISKEVQIKDRYCDLALKVDGTIRLLVEAKAAGVKALAEKHIEQAENYSSRQGLTWVILTNGVEWQLYHLTFNEGEGIAHELAFQANLVDELASDAEGLWSKLSLLDRANLKKGALEDFWGQKKVLSAASVVRVLFHEEVLREVRRLLRKDADAMLDIEDVFRAVRDVISNEALAQAGDLGIVKRRRRRRKVQRTDAVTGQNVTEEIEEDDTGEVPVPAAEVQPAAAATTPRKPEGVA